MSTRQTKQIRGVASAAHIEWPHMTSAVLLSAVTLPPIGFLLLARTPLVLPSMSLIALAMLSHRRLGGMVFVVQSPRRRHYPVGYLGRVCVHWVCSRHAQRSSTSDRVLIRAQREPVR